MTTAEHDAVRDEDGVVTKGPTLNKRTGRYVVTWIEPEDNVKHTASGATPGEALASMDEARRRLANRALQFQLETSRLVGQLTAYGLEVSASDEGVLFDHFAVEELLELLQGDCPSVPEWLEKQRERRSDDRRIRGMGRRRYAAEDGEQ
jgi:hypothetical protein